MLRTMGQGCEKGDRQQRSLHGHSWAQVPCLGPKAAWLPSHVHTPSSFPAPPTQALLSPLDEFLEHIPSEVLTNLFDVWLRKEAGGW